MSLEELSSIFPPTLTVTLTLIQTPTLIWVNFPRGHLSVRQMDLTRQLISTNLFLVWLQFSLFFCMYLYPQSYMNNDLNLGLFNE